MTRSRFISIGALALVFTLLVLHWSSLHGRLAQEATADDSGYFTDAFRRLDALYRGGLLELFGDLLRAPPHSPYSTLTAFLGFLFLGVHDWVPYLTNGLLVFVLLLFVDNVGRGLSLRTRNILLLATLSVPFCFVAVHEFRPDFAVALLTAMGVFVGVETAVTPAEGSKIYRKVFLGGLLFGAAFLTKPPFFPHTAILSMVPALFLGLASLGWSGRPARGFSHLIRIEACYFAGVFLLPLPFYIWDRRHILDYFLINTGSGAEAPLWRMQGGPLAILAQYTTQGAIGEMLGSFFYAFVFLSLAGLVLYLRARNRAQALLLAGVLLAVAISLSIMVYGRYLNPFFGLTYQLLLLFGAIRSLGPHVRLGTWGNRALAGGFIALAIWNVMAPAGTAFASSKGTNSSPAAQRDLHQLVDVITGNLPAVVVNGSRENKPIVAFAFWGVVNASTFDWLALKRGYDFSIRDLHRYGDARMANQQIAEADFVVLNRPGTADLIPNLPSTPLRGELMETLQKSGTHVRVAEIGGEDGGYVVFKRENLRTLDAGEGLSAVEGPFPKWGLGIVRWGLYPETTIRLSSPDNRRAEIVLDARASLGQRITVLVNGEPVAEHVFATTNFEKFSTDFTLLPGKNRVSFRYAFADKPPGDSRPVAVLFRTIDLFRH